LHCQLLAVLEQSLLLHVIWSQNILLFAFFVFVWAIFLWTGVVLQEELAVLGATI
jgi:hypothetical protein